MDTNELWTVDQARARFEQVFKHSPVITDNEIESIMKMYKIPLAVIFVMKVRSARNAESIQSAIISYSKY